MITPFEDFGRRTDPISLASFCQGLLYFFERLAEAFCI
jgi:hypothetical protein